MAIGHSSFGASASSVVTVLLVPYPWDRLTIDRSEQPVTRCLEQLGHRGGIQGIDHGRGEVESLPYLVDDLLHHQAVPNHNVLDMPNPQ